MTLLDRLELLYGHEITPVDLRPTEEDPSLLDHYRDPGRLDLKQAVPSRAMFDQISRRAE